MKRIFILLWCCIFFFCSVHAQIKDTLFVVTSNNNFSNISNFSEGVAKVEISHDSTIADNDSMWSSIGYIDTTGKILFEKILDDAGNFHCGLAYISKKVNDDSKYGFIDKNGKEVIPCIYDKVENFSGNLTAVNTGSTWQIIDVSGKIVMNDHLLITKRQIINAIAHTSEDEDIAPPAFHNGRMLVCQDGKYGYVDTQGKIVLPLTYYKAFDFSGGTAVVAMDTVNGSLLYKGKGNLERLYNSLPSGPTKYKWTVIDTTGKVLYKFKEEETPDLNQYFSEGNISFSVDSYKNGVMSKNGKIIIPPQYENECLPFSDGVTIVQVDDNQGDGNKNGYFLVIDTMGNTISKISFTNQYGTMYDSNQRFHEGLMAVKINNAWGYIDKKGKFAIAPQFDEATDFHNGCAVVKTMEGKVAVIKNVLHH
ncbi:WG containing repeat-containing protein [Chitinophaga costaii]|uniref:WG containing repeat-containing protein n=1 Tax=Chitinophaga costaii TaxID=1335309 RepID=A0A1C4FUN4_9BACT|nr:WG repeat-containing protein [Chitinophaga costaii]PUZ27199.1 WG repeat-containing protein [Chitinophaga costaii]SCC59231.1 WG containing repeat-containing protein [Chitinophaga costaii]